MTRSFGVDAVSALEALRTVVKRFGDDGLNDDPARKCAVKAWHLCDYVRPALGPKCSFESLRKMQDHTKSFSPELAYLHLPAAGPRRRYPASRVLGLSCA